MARQTSIAYVDDLDGSKATETVKFGLDGKTYEIDLNKKNAAVLRKAIATYIDNGRRVRATTPVSKRAPAENHSKTERLSRHQSMGRRQGASLCPPEAGSPPAYANNTKEPPTLSPDPPPMILARCS